MGWLMPPTKQNYKLKNRIMKVLARLLERVVMEGFKE